jgi:hypothetical protein
MTMNPRLVTEEGFDNISDEEIDLVLRYLDMLAVIRCFESGEITVTAKNGELASEKWGYKDGLKEYIGEINYSGQFARTREGKWKIKKAPKGSRINIFIC